MSEYLPKRRDKIPPKENGSLSNDADSQMSQSSRPGFMTVGTGSMSQNAANLTSMIDNDSGYGGSLHDRDTSSSQLGNDRMDFSETLTDVPVPLSSSSHHCMQRFLSITVK